MNGEEIWTRSQFNFVPQTIELEENETAQQAATRLCTPAPEFFTAVTLPSKGNIFANSKFTLGSSQLGANGAQ